MAIRNFRAIVEYDGTPYSGFQIQPNRRTIQGELEKALVGITQQPVRVLGSGRTDAGVHARGQVVSFRVSWAHGPVVLGRAMNALLPQDIAVRDMCFAGERFHARYSAGSRTYVYSLYCSPLRSPLLGRFAHWLPRPLDLDEMIEASDGLVGEHDYAAFGQATVGHSTVRVVRRVGWREGVAALGGTVEFGSDNMLQFEIEANAFLRGMVRRIVGTLLAVGRGSLTPGGLAEILAAKDIGRASPPVPACGLCLWRVCYPSQ